MLSRSVSKDDICWLNTIDSIVDERRYVTLSLVHTGVEVEVDKNSTATFSRLRLRRQCGRAITKVLARSQWQRHGTDNLIMFSALWTAFNRRQFCVELLLAPDAELSHRPNETNIDLAMN